MKHFHKRVKGRKKRNSVNWVKCLHNAELKMHKNAKGITRTVANRRKESKNDEIANIANAFEMESIFTLCKQLDIVATIRLSMAGIKHQLSGCYIKRKIVRRYGERVAARYDGSDFDEDAHYSEVRGLCNVVTLTEIDDNEFSRYIAKEGLNLKAGDSVVLPRTSNLIIDNKLNLILGDGLGDALASNLTAILFMFENSEGKRYDTVFSLSRSSGTHVSITALREFSFRKFTNVMVNNSKNVKKAFVEHKKQLKSMQHKIQQIRKQLKHS